MATDERQTPTKAARNQALFREVNERIVEITERDHVPRQERWDFVCECSDVGCVDTISLTPVEYEAIRLLPTRFPIKPGHEVPEVERVVWKHEGYWIVEKFGKAGTVAVEADPRR
jgi:hypothetical protein